MFQFFSRRLHNNERGFTLIELLIVVAIIAILAAILIPNFLRARAQSQFAASKGNLKNLATALESYFVDRGSYPDGSGSGGATPAPGLQALSPDYLRTVPRDPCTSLHYEYTAIGTPPTDYEMGINFPTTNACDGLGNPAGGLNYTPGGGLQESAP